MHCTTLEQHLQNMIKRAETLGSLVSPPRSKLGHACMPGCTAVPKMLHCLSTASFATGDGLGCWSGGLSVGLNLKASNGCYCSLLRWNISRLSALYGQHELYDVKSMQCTSMLCQLHHIIGSAIMSHRRPVRPCLYCTHLTTHGKAHRDETID